MKVPIALRAEAEAEFDEAFDYYDDQREGLGTEFASEIQKVLDRIAANPSMHQIAFADIRKGVVRRFPYSIFYRPHANHIEVVAIFHSSRDPSVWQDRASG
ncbi:MAG TPA: type II toxin-antitoxin system RelE/ParE family toxin [Gemmataceae bacterium]